MLAHNFHSEIVMLHVVTAESHAAGVPEDGPEFAGWDMLAEITGEAGKNLDQGLGPELEGLAITDACCSKAVQPRQFCRRLWWRRPT